MDITERIPRGHKVALRDIAAGETVRKLGWPIGRTTHDIARGSHVHTHNLATTLSGPSEYRRRAIRGPHRRSPCLYASVRVLAARRRSGAHP